MDLSDRDKMLLARFRHMMIDSGAKPPTVSDIELYSALKGDTHQEKMRALTAILSMVNPHYWQVHGL